MAFGLDFFDIVPGLRLAGDSLAFAYKFTKKGGQGDGLKGLEIGLTDDPTVKLLEGSVSGYEQTADVDAAYQFLVDGGLTELVPGLAIGIDSLSSIETGDKAIRLGLAGSQPVLVFRYAKVQEVTKVGDGGYTWDLPENTFTALREAAEGYTSDLKTKVDEMIAARLAADGVLQGLITDQGVADAAARAVIEGNLAAEATTRETNDNTIIASVASEASTREAADTALSGRLDTLESDPTTAAAVAAGDAATLSSANTYTDTSITNLVNGADAALDTLKEIGDALAQGDSDVTAALTAQITTEATARANADTGLSGRLDTLEADPTTQTLLDAETTARTSADTALDGRVATLEGNAAITDPTTATAVAAVQSDVDANQTASESADAALSGRLDVLEADPTTQAAVDLKANKAGDTFTGDVIIDEGTGSTIKLETSDATSAGIHIEGPTGSMGYLDTTNGFGNDSLQVYSANFWVRAINGGTGNVIIDGNISAPGVPGPYNNDGDAASNGVAVNSLYYNGSGHVHIRIS